MSKITIPLEVGDMPALSKRLASSPKPVVRKFMHSLAWHCRDSKDRHELLEVILKEFKLRYVPAVTTKK